MGNFGDMMSFHYLNFNNFYMTNPFMYSGYMPASFMPCGYYGLYNPFLLFNSIAQLVTGKSPSLFNDDKSKRSDYNNYYYNNYNAYGYYNFPLFSFNNGFGNYSYNSLYDGMYPVKDYSKDFIYPSFVQTDLSKDYNKDYTYKPFSYNSSNTESYRPIYSTITGSHLTKEFLAKVKQVAKNINCDYEDLLAVMNSESTLNPASVHKNKNGKKTAVGLIQFTESGGIAELNRTYGLNLTIDKIEKMSAIEQLDLVEKYYKITTKKFGGKKLSAADLYAVTYVPGFAKNEILTRRGDGYYEGNEGLDENGDGVISKDDLNKHLAKKRVNLDTFA